MFHNYNWGKLFWIYKYYHFIASDNGAGKQTPLPKPTASGLELTSRSTAESSWASSSWSGPLGRFTATSWKNSAHTRAHTDRHTLHTYNVTPSLLSIWKQGSSVNFLWITNFMVERYITAQRFQSLQRCLVVQVHAVIGGAKIAMRVNISANKLN